MCAVAGWHTSDGIRSRLRAPRSVFSLGLQCAMAAGGRRCGTHARWRKRVLYFLSMEATRDQRWTSTTHRASLEAAEATRTRLIVEAAKGRERAGEERSQQPADAIVLSRWIGPSLRVLIGTGLATANAAIGVTAGHTATIATIGATAVPTYVGVATSIYTGLA